MSIVRFSTKLMMDLNTQLWSGGQPTFLRDGGGNNRRYSIFKGAVPSSAGGNRDSRESDLLVRWNSSDTPPFRTLSVSLPETTVQSPYVLATGTGQATWMWITAASGLTVSMGIVLTVSEPGGGGEVVIANASIETGRQYKLNDIILSVPTDYTF